MVILWFGGGGNNCLGGWFWGVVEHLEHCRQHCWLPFWLHAMPSHAMPWHLTRDLARSLVRWDQMGLYSQAPPAQQVYW